MFYTLNVNSTIQETSNTLFNLENFETRISCVIFIYVFFMFQIDVSPLTMLNEKFFNMISIFVYKYVNDFLARNF